MITQSKKIFLLITLLVHPLQSFSFDFPFPTREVGIGASAFAIGAIGTFIGSSLYHPAALARKELEIAQTEKNKKEHAEKIEKERQHAAELERLHAENRLLYVKHTYSNEFELIRKEKLQEKELLNIIKEKWGMHDQPLNKYHATYIHDIELLTNLEMALPVDKQQERLTLMSNLERIDKIYNSQISDKAKHEREEAENKRRKEAKEHAEITLLHLKADTIKEKKHLLANLSLKVDAISNSVTTLSGKLSENSHETNGSVNALRIKLAQDIEDLKRILAKANEAMENKFALLLKQFEQIRNSVNNLLSQQQAIAQTPPPSYNPEVYPQMPKPSAPPL